MRLSWHALILSASLCSLGLAGCADGPFTKQPSKGGLTQVSEPDQWTVVSERTVTVSADDTSVEVGNGERIGVDGVPPGKTRRLRITRRQNQHGKWIEEVSEPNGEPPLVTAAAGILRPIVVPPWRATSSASGDEAKLFDSPPPQILP